MHGRETSLALGGFVNARLWWHCLQSRQPEIPIHADSLLMSVLTHEDSLVRYSGARSVGISALRAAADECDLAGKHLTAAELMFAASCVLRTLRDDLPGVDARRAWALLRQLEEAGQGSEVSRVLELRTGNKLLVPSKEHLNRDGA